jgi:hypothetical protein
VPSTSRANTRAVLVGLWISSTCCTNAMRVANARLGSRSQTHDSGGRPQPEHRGVRFLRPPTARRVGGGPAQGNHGCGGAWHDPRDVRALAAARRCCRRLGRRSRRDDRRDQRERQLRHARSTTRSRNPGLLASQRGREPQQPGAGRRRRPDALGRAQAELGRPTEARKHVEAAQRAFSEIGGNWDDDARDAATWLRAHRG